jgi:hypothetical protein
MFVGNFTDAEGLRVLRRPNGRSPGDPEHPNMRTWENLYKLFGLADFRKHEMFFTNVYVGLKEGVDGGGRFPGAKDESFRAWCRDFLDDQIRIMEPRAIVTLGSHARKEFKWPKGLVGPSKAEPSQNVLYFECSAIFLSPGRPPPLNVGSLPSASCTCTSGSVAALEGCL